MLLTKADAALVLHIQAGEDAGVRVLENLTRFGRSLDLLFDAAVMHARHHGVPWRDIGAYFNLTPNAARRRFAQAPQRLARARRQRDRRRSTPDPSSPTTTGSSPVWWRADDADVGAAALRWRDEGLWGDQGDLDVAATNEEALYLLRAGRREFQRQLRQLYELSGLPLRRIAAQIDISVTYLFRMLNGRTPFPAEQLVAAYVRACGADPSVIHQLWQSCRIPSNTTPPSRAHPTAANNHPHPTLRR